MARLGGVCAGALVSVLFAASGCGGSSGPPALIGPFTIADSAFNGEDASGFVFHGTTTIVAPADYSGVCSHSAQGSVPNSKFLAVALAAVDASGNATPISAPGRYAIVNTSAQAVNGLFAQAYFQHLDATCSPDVELEAITGDVTVTRIDNSALEGDLHITAFVNDMTTAENPAPVRTGDQVTAHFAAVPCPTLTFNSSPPCP
jgi:hypothetical protein